MTIKIEISGETPQDVLEQLVTMAGTFIAKVEGGSPVPEEKPKPKPRPKKATKPTKPAKTVQEEVEDEEILVKATEPETAPEQDPAAAKKDALSILMELYNKGGDDRDNVKALLEKYGVKKFSEIAEDDGVKLLADAENLRKETA